MADTQTSPTPAPAEGPSFCSICHLTAAFLLLRLWMGARLILSGLEKFGFTGPNPSFEVSSWFGNGFSLFSTEGENLTNAGFGDGRLQKISTVMLDNTWMSKTPALVKAFLAGLPFAMLAAGVLILLGLFNRLGWFLAGFIWFSLAFGQMLLPDEDAILWLTLYFFICALALSLINFNRIRITKF